MPHPIVCLDERLRKYLHAFQALFSRPQFEHFVTMLIALLMSLEGHTLAHLHRAVAGKKSLSSISRFLGKAPWDHGLMIQYNFSRFCRMIQPHLEQEQHRLLQEQPKRHGRRKLPLVTGYLIGDDSTMSKTRGVKMQGLGRHYSTTQRKCITGHSLVESLYTVLGRICPLEPFVYRQQETAEKENVPFMSKVDLMIQYIQNFTPPSGTLTHVLLDSWYSAKAIWKAARDRGFLITTGLKCNRCLRVPCDRTRETPQGWEWQRIDEYAAALPEDAYKQMSWPRNPKRKLWGHVVDTRIRKLYRCKLIILRESLDDPIEEARFWASSDLTADAQTLLEHMSMRWDIEVFFEDMKELFGIDQYQLMTTTALLRYWSLCWIAFSYLEEIRDELKQQTEQKSSQAQDTKLAQTAETPCVETEATITYQATLGQARRKVQHEHQKLFLEWVYQQASSGMSVKDLHNYLVA